MEIKHTIEILAKDIQDIEKLVRNLNNYTTPPQIELDLAMSKLRHVYELLSMISIDSKNDQLESSTIQTEPEAETQTVSDSIEASEEIREEEEVEEKEDISLVEEVVEKEVVEEILIPEEPAIQELFDAPKEASILAEKFETDKSLNEKIAPSNQSDLSSKIKGGPIDSIKRNIGINDRFLIIRELMNGDNEGFNQIIQKLDDCTNFNTAFTHIQTRFPDHLEHEGVKILINLSRRKFISSGNV
jgi:hypothetical protein